MMFGFECGSHCLTDKLVLDKYVKLPLCKRVLTLSSLLYFPLTWGFFSCKGVHGGQIQPVTTRLRVNIREYGDHIEFSHFTHVIYYITLQIYVSLPHQYP